MSIRIGSERVREPFSATSARTRKGRPPLDSCPFYGDAKPAPAVPALARGAPRWLGDEAYGASADIGWPCTC
jgi:hypothetical protein